MNPDYLYELARYAISLADPMEIVPKYLSWDGNCIVVDSRRICLDEGSRIYIIGAGKASGKMALAVEELFGERIAGGVVSVPDYMLDSYESRRIEFIGAGHPVPNENSIVAAEKIMDLVEKAGEKDIVIALISGGGSALLEKPIPPVTLEELRYATSLLLDSGADIREINTVRKHLSMVKGGRLAARCGARALISLIISDVPGDHVGYIASGPTAPDETTYDDAINVLKRYGLWDRMPESIRKVLLRGSRGEIPETPKPGDPVFDKVVNKIIASNLTVLEKLAERLRGDGYKPLILTSRIEGESREVGKALASIALEAQEKGYPARPPLAILVGGETTVTVRRKGGRGGRCQELVLSFLAATRGRPEILVASFDTDGIDGLSNAAGAVGAPEIWRKMIENHDNPWRYLDENNSYEYFKKYGGLIITGPTGTNVNTITIILVGEPEKMG